MYECFPECTWVPGTCKDLKKVSDSLELKSGMVGNQIWVLFKTRKYSYLQSHLSSPVKLVICEIKQKLTLIFACGCEHSNCHTKEILHITYTLKYIFRILKMNMCQFLLKLYQTVFAPGFWSTHQRLFYSMWFSTSLRSCRMRKA